MSNVIPFPRPRRDAPVSGPLPEPDFHVSPLGDFVTLQPLTVDAHDWITANLPTTEDNWWCGAVVIAPRYWDRIAEGIADAGLVAR